MLELCLCQGTVAVWFTQEWCGVLKKKIWSTVSTAFWLEYGNREVVCTWLILDSLEKLEAKEAKSVVNKRLPRLQFCFFAYLILPCGDKGRKDDLCSTGWHRMIVWASVWKEREMSVLRWELEALESEGAVVASLGCLLQLLCQRRLLSCKSVEGNEKANRTDLWVDERKETQKGYPHRGGGHNRNEGLEMVTAKISQGNKPFGCWESSKKEANSRSWVNQTPCFEWVQEGVERSRLVRGEDETQQTEQWLH